MDSLLARFTEQTGIKVETLYIIAAGASIVTKLQTMIAGGDQFGRGFMPVKASRCSCELDIPTPIDDYIAAQSRRGEDHSGRRVR